MTTTAIPSDAASVSPFFGDARACKAWLAALPMTSIAQAQVSLLDALRVFNRGAFEPLERLKCLELLRDRIAFMLGEQRTRSFSRLLPLAPGDAVAWTNARNVLEEMEAGYRKCLAEPALAEHAALVTQRIVRYIGAQMLLHSLVYRPFDAALWTRLHEQYASAERAGIADTRVKDSLESEGGASSVMEAYARVVLMQAAGLPELTPAQVAFADALLRQWMRKVRVVDRAPAEVSTSVLPMVVDLSQASGASAAPRDALAPTQRVIDVESLSRSIRRRIRALQAGDDVGTLGLPAEVGAVDAHHTLQRLVHRWCEPGTRESAPKPSADTVAGLVFGVGNVHLHLSGGKAFEQPDKERELSRQEKEDIAVFGRVTQRTQSMMTTAAQNVLPEPWDVLDEAPGRLRLRRRASATQPIGVGRLVGVRLGDGGELQVAVVRALHDDGAALTATVEIFPGKADPKAVRGPKPPWVQGLLLPAIETLGMPASLVVPGGLAFKGRPLFVWQGGAVEGRVQEVVERGADFDRVTLF